MIKPTDDKVGGHGGRDYEQGGKDGEGDALMTP
jgi:hypothetical protein